MQRPAFLAALVGLTALIALPGCKGGGGGGGGIAYEDLQDQQLDALCDYLVSCGYASSAEICIDAFSRYVFGSADLDAAIANGSVIYDPVAAETCGNGLRNAECSDFFTENFAEIEACDLVFQGTVDEGGTCWINEQCVSGACEQSDCGMACCEGTCIAPPPDAAVGEDCSGGQVCAAGAFCEFDTGLCTARLTEGSACGGGYECASGLDCIAATCQTPPGEGAACLDFQCAQPYACDIDSMTCQQLRDEGEACNPTASICSLGLVCSADSNTCTLPGGVGSSCSFDGFSCGAGTYCDYDFMLGEGSCQPLKDNGGACGSDNECVSYYCGIDSVCEPEPVCVQ